MIKNKITNPRHRKLSAFALAKLDFNVRAEIGVDDVRSLRPTWSEQQCIEFLQDVGNTIGREMVASGAMALAALLEGDQYAN